MKKIIWDIDGTLNYLPEPKYYAVCEETKTETGVEFFPFVPRAKIQKIAFDSYKNYGDSFSAFRSLVETQTEMTFESFRLQFFKKYHTLLRKNISEKEHNFFAYQRALVEVFKRTAGVVQHGVATHCCMEGWGLLNLHDIGILPYFEPNALFGFDQYEFVNRSKSARGMKAVMQVLAARPEETYCPDDSKANLERNFEEIKGVTNIYIHHGKPLDPLPSYISAQFDTALNYMLWFERKVKPRGQRIRLREAKDHGLHNV